MPTESSSTCASPASPSARAWIRRDLLWLFCLALTSVLGACSSAPRYTFFYHQGSMLSGVSGTTLVRCDNLTGEAWIAGHGQQPA